MLNEDVLPADWEDTPHNRDLWKRYASARNIAEGIHASENHPGKMKDCIECKSGFALLLVGSQCA